MEQMEYLVVIELMTGENDITINVLYFYFNNLKPLTCIKCFIYEC